MKFSGQHTFVILALFIGALAFSSTYISAETPISQRGNYTDFFCKRQTNEKVGLYHANDPAQPLVETDTIRGCHERAFGNFFCSRREDGSFGLFHANKPKHALVETRTFRGCREHIVISKYAY